MDKIYYFDNAATTFPKPDRVIDAVTEIMKKGCFNAGRGTYSMAIDAAGYIDTLKSNILEYAGSLRGGNVILTSGATIAFNMLLGGIYLEKGSRVYVSPFEHNAVMRVLYEKQRKQEFIIKELPIIQESMTLDMEKIEYEFSRDIPDMVCISEVSNVTGYILPINKICSLAKENNRNVITVVDGCQALGLIYKPLLENNNVDYYVFAGHKTMYGPFGIGGIICHSAYSQRIITNSKFYRPYIFGGTGRDSLNLEMMQDTPEMLEAGSIDIIAVKGLSAALEDIKNYFPEEKIKTEKLVNGLKEVSKVQLYIPKNKAEHINIVSFNVRGYSSQELGMILDNDYGIAVRTGYHCSPLIHTYLKDEIYNGTVRASIGRYTTEDEISYFVNAVKEIAQE